MILLLRHAMVQFLSMMFPSVLFFAFFFVFRICFLSYVITGKYFTIQNESIDFFSLPRYRVQWLWRATSRISETIYRSQNGISSGFRWVMIRMCIWIQTFKTVKNDSIHMDWFTTGAVWAWSVIECIWSTEILEMRNVSFFEYELFAFL